MRTLHQFAAVKMALDYSRTAEVASAALESESTKGPAKSRLT
jgi:hypothetical protein